MVDEDDDWQNVEVQNEAQVSLEQEATSSNNQAETNETILQKSDRKKYVVIQYTNHHLNFFFN